MALTYPQACSCKVVSKYGDDRLIYGISHGFAPLPEVLPDNIKLEPAIRHQLSHVILKIEWPFEEEWPFGPPCMSYENMYHLDPVNSDVAEEILAMMALKG